MNLMWDILPPHTIANLAAISGTLHWTAPDTEACRIAFQSSEFTSSDDSGDMDDGDEDETSSSMIEQACVQSFPRMFWAYRPVLI